MTNWNSQVKLKLLEAINRLQLNLSEKIVLTEAASGPYIVTPLIAALAGAEVFAFTKTTKYGSIKEIKMSLSKISEELGIPKGKIHIIEKLHSSIISKADIITNSGHLRPLNAEKLQFAKKNAVVSLMYEAWELRHTDLDMVFCKNNHIRVGATNENHPDVDVFNYLGDMALKMIFDAGLCPNNNNFFLLCNNRFGPFIAKVLSKNCKSLAVCDKKENKFKYNNITMDWIGDFPDFTVPEKYMNCEAILFTAYPFEDTWIGKRNVPISIEKLKLEIKDPFILRFAGHIDEVACKSELRFFPENVPPGHMGILPSAIGYDPIIRLQAGGLKVAETMLNNETHFKGEYILEKI